MIQATMVLPSLQVLVQMLYYHLRWRAGTLWQDGITQFNSHTTGFAPCFHRQKLLYNSRNDAFQEHISAEVWTEFLYQQAGHTAPRGSAISLLLYFMKNILSQKKKKSDLMTRMTKL